MAVARYQHTIQIPEDVEQLWIEYKNASPNPPSFSAFIIRLIKQELTSEHASA